MGIGSTSSAELPKRLQVSPQWVSLPSFGVVMTLDEFLTSPLRNTWLYEPGMAIYVRKSSHLVNGAVLRCLDVANVEIERTFQKKGLFTRWLAKAEALVEGGFQCVLVENVHNSNLPEFLKRNGYVDVIELPTSYVKILRQGQE